MLVFEAKWSGGRVPLNALPQGRAFAFSPEDGLVLDRIEALADGETPAVMQIDTKALATLLRDLAGHSNITLGKATEVTVTKTPLRLAFRATLEATGEIVVAYKDKTAALTMVEESAAPSPI